ncbi:MAG: hypothetical protein MJ224_01300 [archaeon]|nr:hypothetical protein [archaeon]
MKLIKINWIEKLYTRYINVDSISHILVDFNRKNYSNEPYGTIIFKLKDETSIDIVFMYKTHSKEEFIILNNKIEDFLQNNETLLIIDI